MLKFIGLLVGTALAGYGGLSYYLNVKFPLVKDQTCLADMRRLAHLQDKHTYVPYMDMFKVSVEGESVESVVSRFFECSPIKYAFSSSLFRTEVISKSVKPSSEIVTFQWSWRHPDLVRFFEKLSDFGYPFRLMNGGIQQLQVRPIKGSNMYEVLYSNGHIYNDLRDGKIVPKWTLHLHRTYARIILLIAYF